MSAVWRLALVLAVLAAGCRSSEQPQPEGSTPRVVREVERPGQAGEHRQTALVEFIDAITDADRAWIEAEGFEIVREFPEHATMMVRVPTVYDGDPVAKNPRIVAFEVRMR